MKNNFAPNYLEQLSEAKTLMEKNALLETVIRQLTAYNEQLQLQLSSSEAGCKSLYKYICELHKCMGNNFHRTPIEEIMYHEIGNYIKQQKNKSKE